MSTRQEPAAKKARADKQANARAIRLARPPALTVSSEFLDPVPHSPLWLLPAGLSDDELLAAYGGGAL